MTAAHTLILAVAACLILGLVALWWLPRARPRVWRSDDHERRARIRAAVTGHRQAPSFSQRGFAHFDPIEGRYGGSVEVYESSAASAPCMWVGIVPPTAGIGPVVHLHLDDATRLRDQLTYLIEHHYQLEQR